jgi:hypothetical protein
MSVNDPVPVSIWDAKMDFPTRMALTRSWVLPLHFGCIYSEDFRPRSLFLFT